MVDEHARTDGIMTARHAFIHLDLLRAALLDGDAGTRAFQAWQSTTELDDLPPQQHALLPMLYHKIEASGIDHPWLSRLKGYYRRTWYANQMTLRVLGEVLDRLSAVNLPCMVVGASALAHSLYPEVGLRPIHTPEILVPFSVVGEAMRILQDMGWQVQPASRHVHRPAFLTAVVSRRFVNNQGQSFTLGWHVVPTLPCPDLDTAFWSASVELMLGGRSVRTLCPADHLLRICLTFSEGGVIVLADAALLVRSEVLDWQRFLALAGRFRAGRPALHVLETLASVVGVAAPAEVSVALRRLPVSFAERRIPMGMTGFVYPATRVQRFWRLLARCQRAATCAASSAGHSADQHGFADCMHRNRA